MRAAVLFLLLLVSNLLSAQYDKFSYYRKQAEKFLDEDRFKEARLYSDSAVQAIKGIRNYDSLESIYRWRFRLDSTANDHAMALADFKLATAYKDSIVLLRLKAVAEDLIGRLQAEREAHRTDSIRSVVTLQQLRESHSRDIQYWSIGAGGLLIFLLIAVTWLYRRVQAQRQQLNQVSFQLQEHTNFKEKLFAVLSYDLKNSLTSLENLTQGVAGRIKTFTKEETSDYLANLQTTTVDLKDTLSNVIHWTALQANERPVAPQYIDCQSLVQSLISKTEAQYSQKKLTIDVFIPEGQQVFADRSMIETVLQNLFSNAIHFTPAGGRITFFSGRNEDLVTLGVKDTGIGIRKEDVARLFSAKEDFHTIGKSRHKGAGVGLLVCKEMVERNGGRMYVESEEGQGSNFYFSLPERKIN